MTRIPGKDRTDRKTAVWKRPRLLAVMVVALCLGISFALIPVSFETNDDAGIMSYVSGARTGEPEADTIFSLFLWGKLQASLYTLAPGIPWYAIMFLLLIAVSQWVFFAEVIRLAEKAGCLWLGVLCSAALYALLFLYYTVRLQFTVVSAFCGIGALTLMIARCRADDRRKLLPGQTAIFLLTMFSVNIRSKVALLLLGSACGVCGIEFLFLILSRFSGRQKRVFRNVMVSLLVIAGAIMLSLGTDYIHMTRTEGWKEFRQYHIQRAGYTDYGKLPYWEYEDLYRSVGWGPNLFRMINSWFFMDENVTTEAFQAINEYTSAVPQNRFGNAMRHWRKNGVGQNPMIVFQTLVWLGALVCCGVFPVIRGKKRKKDPRAFLPAIWFAAFLAESFYFAWIGRMVQRALEASLLLTAVPSMLCMVDRAGEAGDILSRPMTGKRQLKKAVPLLLPVIILILSVSVSASPYQTAVSRSKTAWVKRKTLMEEYAMDHPETLFVYDTSLAQAMNSPWDVYPERQPTNLLYWGGSGYNSPLYFKQLRKNGLDSLLVGDFLSQKICFIGAKGPNNTLTEFVSERLPDAVCQRDDSNRAFGLYRFVSLPAPKLIVEPLGENRAMLSWDPMEGAELYRITRREEGETEWTDLCEITENRFIDETVKPGGVYYYRIRACAGGTWKASNADGADTASLSFQAVGEYSGYQFRCVVSDSSGAKVISNAAEFSFHIVGPIITEQPLSITVVAGDPVEFSVAVYENRSKDENDEIDAISANNENDENGPEFQWQISKDGVSWTDVGLYDGREPILRFTATAAYDGCLFRCVVSDGSGWKKTSDPAQLTIASPKITKQPQSVTMAVGDRVTFTTAARGVGLKYQWQVSADDGQKWIDSGADGSDTSVLSFTAMAVHDGYRFRCVVTDDKGMTVVSNAAILTITGGPEITAQPQDAVALAGDTVTFSAAADGDGLAYRWQVSADGGKSWKNSNASGSSTAILSFTAEDLHDGYRFRCVVSDGVSGKSTSDEAVLTIIRPRIVLQPRNVTASVGETVALTVGADGDGLRYRWLASTDGGINWKDSSAEGADTAELRFTAAAVHDGYRFCCVVLDERGGKTVSDVSVLTIRRPTITLQPQNVTAASLKTACFSVEASGTGLKYQWQVFSAGGWSDYRAEGIRYAHPEVSE